MTTDVTAELIGLADLIDKVNDKPRLWRWCSTRGRGYMLEPGAELCPGCHAPIPPTPSAT